MIAQNVKDRMFAEMPSRMIFEGFEIFGMIVADIDAVSKDDGEGCFRVIPEPVIEYVEMLVGFVDMRVCSYIEHVFLRCLNCSGFELCVHLHALLEAGLNPVAGGYEESLEI